MTSRIHWWPWIWPWPSNDLEIRKKCSFCGENAYISISARLNSLKIGSPIRLYVYFRFSEKKFERNSYFRFMSNFSKNPIFDSSVWHMAQQTCYICLFLIQFEIGKKVACSADIQKHCRTMQMPPNAVLKVQSEKNRAWRVHRQHFSQNWIFLYKSERGEEFWNFGTATW